MRDCKSNRGDNGRPNDYWWCNPWRTDTEQMARRTRGSNEDVIEVCRNVWEIRIDINAGLWRQNSRNGGPNVHKFLMRGQEDQTLRIRCPKNGSRKKWRWKSEKKARDYNWRQLVIVRAIEPTIEDQTSVSDVKGAIRGIREWPAMPGHRWNSRMVWLQLINQKTI